MKQTEEFKLRIDPNTREKLLMLAQGTGKSGSAIIRDLINQAAQQPQQPKKPAG